MIENACSNGTNRVRHGNGNEWAILEGVIAERGYGVGQNQCLQSGVPESLPFNTDDGWREREAGKFVTITEQIVRNGVERGRQVDG